MADNETEATKATEDATTVSEAEPALSGDQNFAYWITMLPFIGIAGVFLFEFSKTPGEYNKLYNAAGAVVVGIFFASLVNAMTNEKKEEGANAEVPKAESSS